VYRDVANSDDEEAQLHAKKRVVRSPIALRSRRLQVEETTRLGSKRARKMQSTGYSALQQLEAAHYAKMNKGPDPHMLRVPGPMVVPTRVPPGVTHLPHVHTTITEEVTMGGDLLHRDLLKTIAKIVTSK